MLPVLFTVRGVDVPAHAVFVCLGVVVAAVVFVLEARRRDAWDDRLLTVVAFVLVGGGIGMRAAGLVRHLDPAENPPPLDAFLYGTKSVLGGLTGAYLGALLGKRVAGYRARTGDLFAPAVALGMAVGRVGCFLVEAPGRATTLPWAVHVNAPGIPHCPACVTGAGMHPSFLYEIAFHVAAFAALRRLGTRPHPPGALLTYYLAAYAGFRFLVEFVRANETVWLGLTRSQWFLAPFMVLGAAHVIRRVPRLAEGVA